MNALVLTLTPSRPLRLPMAYQQYIQGALYHAWSDTIPELHDEGYVADGRTFRMFTFSALEGKYEASGSEIMFSGPLTLEVRSPVPGLLEPLAEEFSAERKIRLLDETVPITALHSRDCLIFPEKSIITMRTPLSVHRTLEDGRTLFLSPEDEDFRLLIAENLASKISAAGLTLDPAIGLEPISGTLRKRVSTFKGNWITGYTGRFIFSAAPETVAFLYYTGLGVGNSRGFGMFDFTRPL